jgi:hypothetical protein
MKNFFVLTFLMLGSGLLATNVNDAVRSKVN